MDTASKKSKPKSNPKGRYIIHSKHEKLPSETGEMSYISFDPGQSNFTVRLEKRCKGSKYCKSVTTLAQDKHTITFQRSFIKSQKATQSLCTSEIIEVLNSYKEFYPSVTIALVEGQMAINTAMMHMQSVIIAYFLLTQPHIVIVEVSSKLKGTNLGAPDLSRHHLKKWGVEKAMYLAEQRGDKTFIDYINKQRKRPKAEWKIDDDTDNYIQIEAFCVEAKYQLTKTNTSKSKYKGPAKLVPVKSPSIKRRVVKKTVVIKTVTIEESSEGGSTITESSISSDATAGTISSD